MYDLTAFRSSVSDRTSLRESDCYRWIAWKEHGITPITAKIISNNVSNFINLISNDPFFDLRIIKRLNDPFT